MGSLTGKVVSVDPTKGFITCDKGVSHYFTPNKMAADHPFTELKVGDSVNFEAYAGPRGMRARQIKKQPIFTCWEIASDFKAYTKQSGLTIACDDNTYGVADLEVDYLYHGDFENAKRELIKLLKEAGYNFVQGLESWVPVDEHGAPQLCPVLRGYAGVYFTHTGAVSTAEEQDESQRRIESEAEAIRAKGRDLAERLSQRSLWPVSTIADHFVILGNGKTLREDERSLSAVDLSSGISRDKNAGREHLIQLARNAGANCVENVHYSTHTDNKGNYHFSVFQWHLRAHQYVKVTHTDDQSVAEAQNNQTDAHVQANHQKLIQLQSDLKRLADSYWSSGFQKFFLIVGLGGILLLAIASWVRLL